MTGVSMHATVTGRPCKPRNNGQEVSCKHIVKKDHLRRWENNLYYIFWRGVNEVSGSVLQTYCEERPFTKMGEQFILHILERSKRSVRKCLANIL